MQNGRNRIAAHGRTKAGHPVPAAKRTRRKRSTEPAKAAVVPAFPTDVKVALPVGNRVAATIDKPKTTRRAKANAAQVRRRKPGRKKREAARELATLRHTAVVVARSPRRVPAPPKHPVTPDVIHLAHLAAPVAAAVMPLPQFPEPLVVARTIGPVVDLPRGRALARPGKGLVAAISDWIRSARRLVLIGLLPRKTRAPLPKPPTHAPRRPVEIERLRRENDALRQRVAAMEAIEALQAAHGAAKR